MSVRFTKAIVVGASSGIGAAIAMQLAREGVDVAILARRESELFAVSQTVPGRIRGYVHDVAQADDVPAMFDRVVADLGGLDLLVYAAGVMPKVAEDEFSTASDRLMMAVNVVGAIAWMNPAAARFQAARAGTILGISSIAGERGRRGNPVYCTSKAALSTYLEALRNRTARYGVNVVTVKPGFVDTAMTQGLGKLPMIISAEKAAAQSLALARRGTSASGFVPWPWQVVALIIRHVPSFVFRRTNV